MFNYLIPILSRVTPGRPTHEAEACGPATVCEPDRHILAAELLAEEACTADRLLSLNKKIQHTGIIVIRIPVPNGADS